MQNTRNKLVHAVTEYDRRQSKRSGYNRYALSQYLARVDEIAADVAAGANIRQAVVAGFSGRLLDVCLKAVGEAGSSHEESNSAICYAPVKAGTR